ncbi:hypothetical protein DyAD56_11065 [Dyella sp. AD56]|jgi:hypothetical protein|uniref:hypothetical protein n=1 Tax=Dyella sp. AD56 TaxID=1528744 RepID=UPI000C8619D4|nr:hypothetical protein [Dyella sp. AD56]PMQ05111.1 hypothetical protein DyAD56_11065 [Dyella sp. AD56]
MTNQPIKGAIAEEALRNYFLSIGYYVARGVKFTFRRFDVTDVDLWLYARNSPMSRERICVDIKNKKTPQALERIFWAKGLQAVLGLDSCIVATTDSRPDVRDFGLQHNVKVLDGKFLTRLTKSARSHKERITEEDFLADLDSSSLGRLGGDWRGRYEESKSRLLHSLNFDGCNAWLDDIEYLLAQIASNNQAWRLLYASCSHFMIAMDFILREFIAEDQEQRRQIIERGIRYGVSGQEFTEKVGRMAAALVESVAAQPGLASTLQHEIRQQASNVKADLLAEFFAKNLSGSSSFDVALALEAAAFSPQVPTPSALPAQVQSVIGVLADFCGIDRKIALA